MLDSSKDKRSKILDQFPDWEHYVILLGAGASKDAGLPIIRDFSDREYLSRAVDTLKEAGLGGERPDLLEICDRIQESGTGFEQLLAEYNRKGDRENVQQLLKYYQMIFLLTESIAGTFADPATGDLPIAYYLILGGMLGVIPKPIIITFNHDLWIEHGMRLSHDLGMQRQVHYGSIESRMDFFSPPLLDLDHIGFRDPEGRIPLLKLHGSLGYLYCEHCDRFLVGEDNLWYISLLKCRICGRTLEPSYVPPLEEKDPNLYMESWTDARTALRKADLVLVIGYSLPSYDLAARSMLSEVNPEAIVYIVDPFYEQVRKNYEFLNVRVLTGISTSASHFIRQWARDPSSLRSHW
jgi:NAD-dependent SIR2 family protein deacetylase